MAVDAGRIAPAQVIVQFPREDSGTLSPSDFYSVTVTLASLALPEYVGVAGFTGSQVIRSHAIATFAGGGSPTNATDLETLAARLTSDFYLYLLAPVDAVYAGAVGWTLEGLSDHVEWAYQQDRFELPDGQAVWSEEVRLRVQRPPWNDVAEEVCDGPAPVGGGGGGTILVEEDDGLPSLTTDKLVVPAPSFSLTNLGSNDTSLIVGWGTTAEIMDVAGTEAAGTSKLFARADHVHALTTIGWNLTINNNAQVTFNNTTTVTFEGDVVFTGNITGAGGMAWETLTQKGATFNRLYSWSRMGTGRQGSGNSQVVAGGKIKAWPFISPRGGTLDRIGVEVTTAQSGGKCRAGIYKAVSQTELKPVDRVIDGGEIDCSTTGMKLQTISQVLNGATLYWLVLASNDSTIAFTATGIADAYPVWGLESPPNNTGHAWIADFTYGALPDPFPTTSEGIVDAGSFADPEVYVRYSA